MSRRNGARGAAAHSREGVAPPEVRREARARPPARAHAGGARPAVRRGDVGAGALRMGARWRSGARRFAATAVRRDRARASARVGANVAGRVPRWSTRGVRDCVGRASREGGRARSVAAFARTSAQARRGAALGAAVSEFGSPPCSTLVSRTKARPGPGGAWQPDDPATPDRAASRRGYFDILAILPFRHRDLRRRMSRVAHGRTPRTETHRCGASRRAMSAGV